MCPSHPAGTFPAMRPRRLVLALTAALALAASVTPATPAQSAQAVPPKYAYSLLAPANQSPSQLIVRTIQPAATPCPTLTATSATTQQATQVPTAIRPAPQGTGRSFSAVSVCEVAVPAGSTSQGTITYTDGQTLTVPTALEPVSTLAIIGDTGCRLEYNIQQACNSPKAWPLGTFASDIARANPQAIVHLGDYFYDSFKCEDKKKCGDMPARTEGRPYQDSWESFDYTFLKQFEPTFGVAPILPIRGNQERCNIDGISYFYFLDPRVGTSRTCDPRGDSVPLPITDPYAVDLTTTLGTTQRLVVADSTYANDQKISPFSIRMRPKFVAAEKLARATPTGGSTWLLTHRPIFGVRSDLQCGDIRCSPMSRHPRTTHWISTDVAAASYGTLAPYSAIMSGHMHVSQAVQVKKMPGQFIAGAGGTTLDPVKGYTKPKYGTLAYDLGGIMSPKYKPYPTLTDWKTKVEFSYGLAEPTPMGWSIDVKTFGDRTLMACSIKGRTIGCR